MHMSFRYRDQTFRIGDVRIRLRTPRDLEQFIDQTEISNEALPLFGIVWDSSEILSELLFKYDVTGKRILEIGCGMALVSHLLNMLGADITAMDIHPATAEYLANNTLLNNVRSIPLVNASWSDDSPELKGFDLIVGSEVL